MDTMVCRGNHLLVHFVLTLKAHGRIQRDHCYVPSRSIVGVDKGFWEAGGPRSMTANVRIMAVVK